MIKILFLAANPSDTTRLRIDNESRAIEEALRSGDLRDQFRVHKHFAVRVQDLQRTLLQFKPDIVHLSGHGSKSGEFLVEDRYGHTQPVSADALSELFRILKNDIRCVVLNACYSDWQAEAIVSHIGCVVGMKDTISDETAGIFSAAFYGALGNGCEILDAFDLARNQLDLENRPDRDVPELMIAHGHPKPIHSIHPPIPEYLSSTDALAQEADNPDEKDDRKSRPPYRGMDVYDVEHADLFAGREKLIADLSEYLRTDNQFLAVIGASGSGKSSLVRAGLVPALLQDYQHYHCKIIVPGGHPLERLAISLVPSDESIQDVNILIDEMKTKPRSLRIYAERLIDKDDGATRLLLVIDNFEELFTICEDIGEREAFINNLMTAISSDRITTVITLRADFYHHCANYDNLRVELQNGQRYIGAMSEAELRFAIEEPAWRCGCGFEPGLVDQILSDMAEEPGALPLLSHALLETWNRKSENTLEPE